MTFDNQMGTWLASASADAYQTCTLTNPATDTQVLMRPDPVAKRVAIAFRGTNDFRKAMGDGEILLSSPYVKWADGFAGYELGRWHHGVMTAVLGIIEPLIAALQKFPGWELSLTGHSFGGGCAPAAAYLLARRGFKVANVVTFAGMRFADREFAATYNALLGDRTIRVVAQYDVVPHLPLPGWFLPYRHVGHECYLKSPGQDSRLEVASIQMDRPLTQLLLADGKSILKAWMIARSGALELPLDVVRMHSMTRYQRLLSTLNPNVAP